MPKRLKPFVNPRFLRCIDLDLIARLLERHAAALPGFDLAVLAGPDEVARTALEALFVGGPATHPEGLAADLHRITALADAGGSRLIRGQATRLGIAIAPDPDPRREDPKHLALRTFLDHPAVFDAASDMLALAQCASLGEFVGRERGVAVTATEAARTAFAHCAVDLCQADHRGTYCRVGWYGDAETLRIVVTHGSLVQTTPIVDDEAERVISYRKAQHVVVTYAAATGRLEIGGAPRACRCRIAEIFATTLLGRPGFFAGDEAQNLYTLVPIERAGPGFVFRHAHDPGIRSVRLVEVRADRVIRDAVSGRALRTESCISRAVTGNVMERLAEMMGTHRLGSAWRLRHVVINIRLDGTGTRGTSVTVRIRPPTTAAFRRTWFEDRIVALLYRNGLIRDRDADRPAAAAV